jgi:outer membrane protein TolC
MKKAVLVFSLIVTVVGLTSAETLNLEQARALALANSRSLAKYNMSIQNSISQEKDHLYSMLPSLSANYRASMNYLNGDWKVVNPLDTLTASANFSITQKIFEGGKSFIQKSINSIATESVRKEALAEYFNVLDSVDNAYYAVLEATASLEAEESSLQMALANLAIAEIRQASGIINQGDYLKVLADKEARENSRNQARRNIALNLTKLRAIIGFSENIQLEPINFSAYEELIQVLERISDEDANVLYNKFWNILAAANPSLARAALNTQRAEKSLTLTKRESAPVVSATIFSTSVTYSNANGLGTTAGGGISINGNIPIDFWVMNNRLERSKNARDAATLDYIGAEISLETDLQSALISTFAYAGSVLASRRTLEYTERHYEIVAERYRLLQSSVSDLGDASSLLINSRNNYIKSQYGFLQCLSKLRSLGAIDDEEKLINLLMSNG